MKEIRLLLKIVTFIVFSSHFALSQPREYLSKNLVKEYKIKSVSEYVYNYGNLSDSILINYQEYNESGNIIIEEIFMIDEILKDWEISGKYLYTYDRDSKLILLKVMYSNDDGYLEKYTYNKDKINRSQVYDLNGNIISEYQYSYNKDNKLKETTDVEGIFGTSYQYAGDNLLLISDHNWAVEFEYDNLNRIIKKRITRDGNPIESIYYYTFDSSSTKVNQCFEVNKFKIIDKDLNTHYKTRAFKYLYYYENKFTNLISYKIKYNADTNNKEALHTFIYTFY